MSATLSLARPTPTPLPAVRYPQFTTTVLPVADLQVGIGFYCGVFNLDRLDACGRDDFALLGRESTRLSLYRIPGYLPPEDAAPVLVCTLPPADFGLLRSRVRAYGGAIVREADMRETVPRLLFTDPDGCNLIEVRGMLRFAMAHAEL